MAGYPVRLRGVAVVVVVMIDTQPVRRNSRGSGKECE